MNTLYGAVVRNLQTNQYFKGELYDGSWVNDVNDATPFFGEESIAAQDCFGKTPIELVDIEVHIAAIIIV